ncbi:hypothetical protein FCG67_19805 [Rhodococcus oryzae]|jgi:hypothetical protein|uniref:Uncharacterized protein n=1 Tax=Rhodococcus oryzae TaxID=2571143 RepID=A0ABY2RFY5_9NOCA|nr:MULTISPECIES: hypothetical protein [Rhodococcus]PTR36669.1 hypothetical protein C8K38_12362 [Rhodococcus sp. OK611]TJZ75832.1 hypothetical protein FCG67_19805 [Rhodococcus oryzae]SNX93763.1 hypothetical protein SAMN05447004_12362 [Rhodococcus sp. OK270]
MSRQLLSDNQHAIREFERDLIDVAEVQGRLARCGRGLDRTLKPVADRIRDVEFELERVRFLVSQEDQRGQGLLALEGLDVMASSLESGRNEA